LNSSIKIQLCGPLQKVVDSSKIKTRRACV